ncbi:hypothetical protein SE_1399 [Staphylococcus epidermidis ATCC 12228]|uniref:Uncharacterized protein n=1 Tax=Staphylococcus epidermidis (strain ATCC 12228 / FDA PCI 1200) TaxID=176280 RepID=A0A0H2VGZ9_STAES|nr:hypothetical protein SE_1399 [Staphylococcus epidermidis ATCC 12228]EHQ80038.1 hypothetical protein SEVCU057_1383 [Staphylococcus epidermidis VCU057]
MFKICDSYMIYIKLGSIEIMTLFRIALDIIQLLSAITNNLSKILLSFSV